MAPHPDLPARGRPLPPVDGKVLGVLGSSGKQLKQLRIHEIACPSENELYVAEILNWRVQKLLFRPEPRNDSEGRSSANCE